MACSRVVDPPSRLDLLAAVHTRPLSFPALPPAQVAAGAFPIERRNLTSREGVVRRVRAEFEEMPGLCLTLPQARRLFGLTDSACARILSGLAREGLLRCRVDGTYGRRDVRP